MWTAINFLDLEINENLQIVKENKTHIPLKVKPTYSEYQGAQTLMIKPTKYTLALTKQSSLDTSNLSSDFVRF